MKSIVRASLVAALWASAACDEQAPPRDVRDAAPSSTDGAFYTFPCVPAPVTGAPTFKAVYLEVLCTSGCVDAYCHGSRGAWADLSLSNFEFAYHTLVGQPTGKLIPVDGRPTCNDSELLRVAPGDPEHSLLYLKVSGRAPCGTRMPPPSSVYPAVSEPQREQIRAWIARGAPRDDDP